MIVDYFVRNLGG